MAIDTSAAASPAWPPRGIMGRQSPGGGRVIYLICKDGEILVETDNLEFVQRWMRADGECTVRDARTGKKIAMEAEPATP